MRVRPGAPGEGHGGAGQVRAPGRQEATPERRRGLIGELELLALQLPAARHDDPGRDEIVALRAQILELVTEIGIGLADPD